LHRLLWRWCSQMADPPQSLHVLRMRWCSQKADPPHSLQSLRMRWCSQKDDPPQSLHLLLWRWCGHSFFCLRAASILASVNSGYLLGNGRCQYSSSVFV
jgi:hypothetical protein